MGLTARQLSVLEQNLSASKAAVLVTVVEVKGSAPRGPGTTMLVLGNSIVGTIGGGRLEFEAINAAQRMMHQRTTTAFRERYPLGDRLGQCCGGSVELLFEPSEPDWNTWVSEALAVLKHKKVYRRVSGNADHAYTYIIEPPSAHLVLCGAGHVGRALVQVLSNAPISVHWVDERASEFPKNVPSNVHCEVSDLAEVVVRSAPPNSAVLITTHRHDLDFSLAGVAIARTDLAYCGMIGSASKRSRFERQWRKRDREDAHLQRLVCPIGLAGPSGKEPEVVAIAVAAEVLRALQGALPRKSVLETTVGAPL